MAKNRKDSVFTAIRLVLLIAMVLVFFLPLISMVLTSLKLREELFVVPPVVFPKVPQWGNYVQAWTMIRFGRFLLNSIVLTAFYTVPCVMSSCFAGYAFSRFRIRESKGMPTSLTTTSRLRNDVGRGYHAAGMASCRPPNERSGGRQPFRRGR